MKKNNPFIEYYGQYDISPVHQDLSDFNSHLLKRKKLYTQLGIPVELFKDRRILEIGPGGGFNALANLYWEGIIDFVEPNPTAQKELQDLFDKYQIPQSKWKLFDTIIENYNPEISYDIVIAEGFIPAMPNKEEIIEKIKKIVKYNGIVIVTCIDDISIFFEVLKRFIGQLLLFKMNVTEFGDKIKVLSQAFSSHFKSLKYTSRFIEDWIVDYFIAPPVIVDYYSIEDAIRAFSDEFVVLNGSPSIFTDISWYKNIDIDRNELFIKQFQQQRHLFISLDLPESNPGPESNKELANQLREIRLFAGKIEERWNEADIKIFIQKLEIAKSLIIDFNLSAGQAIAEVIQLITMETMEPAKINSLPNFVKIFGRGQQYLSFSKNKEIQEKFNYEKN